MFLQAKTAAAASAATAAAWATSNQVTEICLDVAAAACTLCKVVTGTPKGWSGCCLELAQESEVPGFACAATPPQ